MRLLLDSCVWPPASDDLRAAGHDVDHVGDWKGNPGDDEILEQSLKEDRILVTLDKDFGELVFVFGAEHPGVIRLVNIPARRHAQVILHVLNTHPEDLRRRALIVAEAGRLRIRLPP